MRALTLVPGDARPLDVRDVPDPEPGPGDLLVEGLAVGICGTDREIAAGEHGSAPDGDERLILGHESLGRVRSAPDGSDFATGDLVVGVVRRPDPVPCGACARGHFDMCRNGLYTERGIAGRHGYASELWTVEADYAVHVPDGVGRLGVLMEPTSVVVKAWEQIFAVGARSWFDPERVLVTGAGPIGLLAALVGVQRGLDVHVLDRVEDGPKPDLVRRLGATYHSGPAKDVMVDLDPEIIVEATGSRDVVLDAMSRTSHYGITCLTGVSGAGRRLRVDTGALNRDIVLENDVVVGSVNANVDHYTGAARVLAAADPEWLAGLVTRHVHLDDAHDALVSRPGDIKVVLDLAPGST
ncbi:glucose 1-dehydrogenase [Cellulosimicrobium arenosum]|uniref:Glucose 1-dehydrogenase n=1 Tax=Cellulosimicrobium arenosum TaxID=2708133 RepID=A0A927PGK1_9MICO|nr:glucose 1-dehydrogenase [Cellulosimicrobium arenosum]MBD8080434.1 glucose 1-dehydrogenase [Cellulosimicrobium arenosum]